MFIRKWKIFILIWFSVFLFLPVGVVAGQWQAEASWVPDGDTIYLKSGQKLRLKGIDAPEMGYDRQKEQYYAPESRKGLRSLVKDRDLKIEADSLSADRYGRIVAYAWLPDGRLLNQVLVRQGLAFYYPHPKQRQKYKDRILMAQRRAMNSQQGFWARLLIIPKAHKRYIGNKESKRFHNLNCGFGKRISPRNKVHFSNLRQAFYAGYAPGRKCTPWPGSD